MNNPNPASAPFDKECKLLGTLVMFPEVLHLVYPRIVTPSHVAGNDYREAFIALAEMQEKGLPVDTITLMDYLMKKGVKPQGDGSWAWLLTQWQREVITSAHVEAYAAMVREDAIRRAVLRAAMTAISQCQDGGDVFEVSARLQKSVSDVAHVDAGTENAQTITQGIVEELLDVAQGNTEAIGTIPQLQGMRRLIGAWKAGDLVVVGGRPAMGKSVFAQLICDDFLAAGRAGLLVSLEMTAKQILQRALSNRVGISIADMYRQSRGNPAAAMDITTRLTNASGGLRKYVVNDAVQGLAGLRAAAISAKHKNPDLGVIVVDYVQLLISGDTENRVAELSNITRALKLLAKELDVCMVALSQLSRNVESRTDKRPKLADLRDGGSVEQDADIVLMLYRDHYYNPNADERELEVAVEKFRNGALTMEKLVFTAELSRIEDAQGGHYPAAKHLAEKDADDEIIPF